MSDTFLPFHPIREKKEKSSYLEFRKVPEVSLREVTLHVGYRVSLPSALKHLIYTQCVFLWIPGRLCWPRSPALALLSSAPPKAHQHPLCSSFSWPGACHSESLCHGPAEAPVVTAPPCLSSLLISSPSSTAAGWSKPWKAELGENGAWVCPLVNSWLHPAVQDAVAKMKRDAVCPPVCPPPPLPTPARRTLP